MARAARGLLTVCLGAGIVTVVTNSPSRAGESATTLVQWAALHTQQEGTAVMSVDLSGASLGGITASGTGTVDFATGDMYAVVHYTGLSRSSDLVLQELDAGGHFYLDATENGTGLGDFLPGKSWIEEPAAVTTGDGTGNPAQLLTVLAARGSAVRSLGTSVIGGVRVNGFAVTPSVSDTRAAIARERIPVSLKQGAEGFLSKGSVSYSVWVDARRIIHRFSVSMPIDLSGATGRATVTMNMSHFGAPVTILPPPPEQVATYQQFLSVQERLQA